MANVQFEFDPNQINSNQAPAEVKTEAKVPETKPEATPEQPKAEELAKPVETPEVVEPKTEVKAEEVKTPEPKPKPVKEVAPEPVKRVVDEDTQKFLDYQERTGRGLKDYNELNKDIKKMDPLEVARDRVRREAGGADLTPQDINFLLEEELGFDPTDSDLSDQEKAKFKKFYGSHFKTLENEQQKYNEPVDGFQSSKAENTSQPDGGKKVQLSNGQEVDAEAYEKDRQKYLSERDAALQTIKEDVFKLAYDGKDGKKELSFDYKYTEEDLQSMKSITDDVGGILSNYQKEDGFEHGSFNRDLLWTKPEFRSKAISALLSRARNEVIAELTAQRRNTNFDAPNELPKSTKGGYSEPGEQRSTSGPAVKYSLP